MNIETYDRTAEILAAKAIRTGDINNGCIEASIENAKKLTDYIIGMAKKCPTP